MSAAESSTPGASTSQWPADDAQQGRSRRVRKRDRPPQVPLKDRHFQGCSTLEMYSLGAKLGQGTFGEVKRARRIPTGEDVALKKVTIHEEKDGIPITAIREIKLLKKLRHPAIVPIIDMIARQPAEKGHTGEVYIVEPYMDHDLNGMLENPSINLTPAQIKLYMKQLFEGTLYMHQNKILHRDMKAANLLINNRGQLQIADFGLARPFHDPGQAWRENGWNGGTHSYTSMVVTRWYRPPELLAGDRKYGPPIDMWGLGCILAEMINRKPIFKGASEIHQLELISQICGSPNEQNYPGWNQLPGVKNADPQGRPDEEPDVPGRHDFGNHPRRVIEYFTQHPFSIRREMADLIDKLLILDPRKRITAKEALEHEWFWQPPYPADPNSVPTYQASKEIDRQAREQHRQRAHPQPLSKPQGMGYGGMPGALDGRANPRPAYMGAAQPQHAAGGDPYSSAPYQRPPYNSGAPYGRGPMPPHSRPSAAASNTSRPVARGMRDGPERDHVPPPAGYGSGVMSQQPRNSRPTSPSNPYLDL